MHGWYHQERDREKERDLDMKERLLRATVCQEIVFYHHIGSGATQWNVRPAILDFFNVSKTKSTSISSECRAIQRNTDTQRTETGWTEGVIKSRLASASTCALTQGKMNQSTSKDEIGIHNNHMIFLIRKRVGRKFVVLDEFRYLFHYEQTRDRERSKESS